METQQIREGGRDHFSEEVVIENRIKAVNQKRHELFDDGFSAKVDELVRKDADVSSLKRYLILREADEGFHFIPTDSQNPYLGEEIVYDFLSDEEYAEMVKLEKTIIERSGDEEFIGKYHKMEAFDRYVSRLNDMLKNKRAVRILETE